VLMGELVKLLAVGYELCVCVCVCVCERERERERENHQTTVLLPERFQMFVKTFMFLPVTCGQLNCEM
jgi:hypothetical protein